jgi:hypothetical protein
MDSGAGAEPAMTGFGAQLAAALGKEEDTKAATKASAKKKTTAKKKATKKTAEKE